MKKFVCVETISEGYKKVTYVNLDNVKVIYFIKSEREEVIEFDMGEGVPIKAYVPHDSNFASDLVRWLDENRLDCSVA